MAELMVSVSGIRGIVGESLTPEVITKYVSGFCEYIDGDKIIIGRDSRKTGIFINKLVKSILIAKGYSVVDIGIAPTPTVLLTVEKLKADGGIVVTASHNPQEWNALKLVSDKGMFLTKEEGEKFLNIVKKNKFKYAKYDNIGSSENYKEAIDNHINEIIKNINLDLIRNRNFKVVLDCVNGAGGVISPKLLRSLGCDVVTINEEPNGEFPRKPEPRPEYLDELSRAVKEEDADIGFAHDPDVDRLVVVDNDGVPLSEEYTLVLASWSVFQKKEGIGVCNLSTSRMIEDIAEKYNSKIIRTPVGEVNVAKMMKEKQAIIGGEGNGGVIIPEIHLTRDAPAAMAKILDFLAIKNKKLSALIEKIPGYEMIKDKIKFDSLQKRAKSMKALENISFDDVKNINTEDGLRFEWEKSWLHVRPSGTEPIIRVIGESSDAEWLKNKINYIKNYV